MTAKERCQNKVMSDMMRGSDEYYKNHPDQPKEILEENRRSKEARDQWQFYPHWNYRLYSGAAGACDGL